MTRSSTLVLLAPPRRESKADDVVVDLLWMGMRPVREWSRGGGRRSSARCLGRCLPSLPPCFATAEKSAVIFFWAATSLAPLISWPLLGSPPCTVHQMQVSECCTVQKKLQTEGSLSDK